MTPPATFREWRDLGYSVWPQLRNKQPAYDLLPRVEQVDSVTGEVTEKPEWAPFQSELPNEQMVSDWDLARAGGKPINFACATGTLSGIVVVDIDDVDIAEEFIAEIGPKAASWQVVTSRGVHLYFRHPGNGQEVGNRKYDYAGHAKALDVKGDGGCITLPGSVHADGTVYAFVEEPSTKHPPKLPQTLCNIIDQAEREDREADEAIRAYVKASEVSDKRLGAYATAALDGECKAIRNAAFGMQEGTLNEAALKIGHLVGGAVIGSGVAYQALLAAGLDMPNQMGREKWKAREIERKIARSLRQGETEPRGVPESDRSTNRPERPQSGNGADGAPHYQGEPAPYANGHTQDGGAPSEDEAPRTSFRLRSRKEWVTAGAKLDLVEGVIGRKNFGLIYGPSDAGKSFVAIDLACHIATGRPWHGRSVSRGLVIYIACEGPHSVEMRLEAWFQIHDPDNEDPDILTFVEPVNFGKQAKDADDIIELVNKEVTNRGQPAMAVFIDTAAQSLAGAKENDEGMGALVQNCIKIQRATGATTIPIHHTPKGAEDPRGHTSLPAAADLRMKVKRESVEHPVCAEITRQRDGTAHGTKFWFRFDGVEVEQRNGDDVVESAVLEPIEVSDDGQEGAPKRAQYRISDDMMNLVSRLADHVDRSAGNMVMTQVKFRELAIDCGVIDSDDPKSKDKLNKYKQKLQRSKLIWVYGNERKVRWCGPDAYQEWLARGR